MPAGPRVDAQVRFGSILACILDYWRTQASRLNLVVSR